MDKNYTVEVKTGDLLRAGTSAHVYIQLIGKNGPSPEINLDNPGHDDFERYHLDTFTISVEDVGWIDKIRIRHDNQNKRPGWYLDYIIVTDQTTGLSWRADYYRWLATTVGDKKIDVTADVPIGNVALGSGIVKKVYLGFITMPFINQGLSDTTFQYNFAFQYKSGVSVDTSTAITVNTDMSLGFDFFGVSSNFSGEVSTRIASSLNSSVEQTLNWQYLFPYPVQTGKSITVAVLLFQTVNEGTVYAGDVCLTYKDKWVLTPGIAVFDGLFTDEQIAEKIRQLLLDVYNTSLPAPLPAPLPKRAEISLMEVSVPTISSSSLLKAIRKFPKIAGLVPFMTIKPVGAVGSVAGGRHFPPIG